ncbi:MAG TPA: zinc ribbon domain-containing protein [Pyrinomonadaceae bacterium]|nr:zinc ribbon domain-containing protein [Pyrinomonadaceae bacterium]
MEQKIRCQSCGMPLSETFGNLGTNADGSNSWEYCSFCFQNGQFTNPTQTLAEMIQSSIENMTTEIGMSIEQATQLANSFIPTLRRWQ